jgi:hypothetical protein
MVFAYLAAPYSHPDPEIVEQRMEIYCRVDAKLIKQGINTISPLAKHFVIKYEDIPGDWKYWQNYGTGMVRLCAQIYVICMDGWKESTGVRAEIELAKSLGMPVIYINELGEDLGLLE